MPNASDLRAQRQNVWEQMKEVNDRAAKESRELTAEETQTWDKAHAHYEELTAAIDRAEKSEKIEAEQARVDRSGVVVPEARKPEETEDAYRTAFRNYLRQGVTNLNADERRVLEAGFSQIQNAQGVGTSSAGGYTVPAGFRNELIRTMAAYGSVLDVARVVRTDAGNNLPWPTVNDTSNVGVILAENTQLSEQDATIGTGTLGAYLITSKLTRVSIQLLNDSGIDFESELVSLHGERIGRGMNVYLTTGTGSSQPNGIVTGSATGVTAAGAAAITGDELIDLVHSVDPAYRNERARFMLADATLAKVRKLKDGNNAYLWQPSVQAGVPDNLLGYPVVVNQQMPAATTGLKSVLFGDFYAGYVVRIVNDVTTIRFAERYMDYLQVGFTSFARFDGAVQNTAAYKALIQA